MTFICDPINITNLVLCIVILALGCVGCRRSGHTSPLYIGIAFGLFGASHLAALLGVEAACTVAWIVVRTIAYLLVVFALYQVAFKR